MNGGYKRRAGEGTAAGSTRTTPRAYAVFGLTVGDGKLPNPMTAIFCLIVAVVLCYLVANIRRSDDGRQMLAMRSNERAAAAAGINVSGTKMLAFGDLGVHRRHRRRA